MTKPFSKLRDLLEKSTPGELRQLHELMKLNKRFWTKVNIAGPDECWVWIGSRTKDGYGHLRFNGKLTGAHRVSLMLEGNNPKTLHALHKCDNPPCVNPNHLYLGTTFQNQADSVKRKRHSMSRKTHCPQGHEYGEPRAVFKKGKEVFVRWCSQCKSERSRK